jgi:hypothetical protein
MDTKLDIKFGTSEVMYVELRAMTLGDDRVVDFRDDFDNRMAAAHVEEVYAKPSGIIIMIYITVSSLSVFILCALAFEFPAGSVRAIVVREQEYHQRFKISSDHIID